MNKIATLTHQEEIKLLRQAKKGRTEYDVLGVYHDASEEKIQKAFSNKIKVILNKYKNKDEIKSIKKDCKKQNSTVLLNILINSLDKDKSKEGKKNKAEFEEIKKAYEILSDKQKKAIYDEKNKELFSARNRATRLLIHYNQSFVKYWVSRVYYYSQNEVDPEDLVSIGIAALPDAIKEFDLTRAEKYRLATFAGHYIRQRVNKFVKESQLTPREAKGKVCDFCKREFKVEELKKVVDEQRYICSTCLAGNITLKTEQKKISARQDWSVIYYDRGYYENERTGGSSLLSDTLKDDEEEEQVDQQQKESRVKIDNLLSGLEYPEELITRLYYGLTPSSLTQIYYLATEQKRQELKKIEKNFSLLEKNSTPLIKKYWNFLSRPRKKEAVFQELTKFEKTVPRKQGITQPEFWKYFREVPDEVDCKHCKLVDNKLEPRRSIKIRKEGEEIKHGYEIYDIAKQKKNWFEEVPCAKDFNWPIDYKGEKKLQLTKKKKLEIIFNKEESTTETAFSPQVKTKKSQKMNQKEISSQSIKEKEWNDLLQTWLNNQHTQGFSEKEIRRWISLGYQLEDALDPQNLILQKLGISKKTRQIWEAKENNKKNQSWFEFNLTKKIEKWKKDSEKKLKTWKEKGSQ